MDGVPSGLVIAVFGRDRVDPVAPSVDMPVGGLFQCSHDTSILKQKWLHKNGAAQRSACDACISLGESLPVIERAPSGSNMAPWMPRALTPRRSGILESGDWAGPIAVRRGNSLDDLQTSPSPRPNRRAVIAYRGQTRVSGCGKPSLAFVLYRIALRPIRGPQRHAAEKKFSAVVVAGAIGVAPEIFHKGSARRARHRLRPQCAKRETVR